MKTHSVSSTKTNRVQNSFVKVIVFILSVATISFGLYELKDLSARKIEYDIKALTSVGIILVGVSTSINAYYAAKLNFMIRQVGLTQLPPENKSDNTVSNITQSNIPDIFFKANSLLGHENIETRLGAIYTLESIAKEFPIHHWTVMEILAAYIRHNAPSKPEYEYTGISTDIQTILTIIGRRDVAQDPENQKLDLTNVGIRGANLTGANLRSLDFSGANLQEVIFQEAHLVGCDFSCTNSQEAIFYAAQLQGAIFYQSNLQEALFTKADLTGAMLYNANLQKAILADANLTEAILYKADLQSCNLYEANLARTVFELSNLRSSNLIGSNLQSSNLIGANLEGAILSTANLQSAILYNANLVSTTLYDANFTSANLIGVDFKDAILEQANFTKAYLTSAINLQSEQVESAIGDRITRLPDYIQRPSHWVDDSDNSLSNEQI
jgi:uncharacterized protein YjbI with pentapeptide repeats